MEDTRLPKCVIFGKLVGGAGCAGGTGIRVDCVFPRLPQSFRHQRRPVDDAAQDEGEWCRAAEQGPHFMDKWITVEKARAGLRHAVMCPNVTGRTKARKSQS